MGKQKRMNPITTVKQIVCVGIWTVCICSIASAALAVEKAVPNPTSPAMEEISATTTLEPPPSNPDTPSLASPFYEYQSSARPDPFKPFIAPKTVSPNELIDDQRELTGMQLFEPGQLTLVAIMNTSNGRVAMVEDVTKKGYTIKEGILIGKYGEVTEIGRDQVIVTETAHTRGGEEIKTVVAMKLKRDGEGQ